VLRRNAEECGMTTGCGCGGCGGWWWCWCAGVRRATLLTAAALALMDVTVWCCCCCSAALVGVALLSCQWCCKDSSEELGRPRAKEVRFLEEIIAPPGPMRLVPMPLIGWWCSPDAWTAVMAELETPTSCCAECCGVVELGGEMVSR